jgi:hypothetical protein
MRVRARVRAVRAVLAIASGEWDEDAMEVWLQARLSAPGSS